MLSVDNIRERLHRFEKYRAGLSPTFDGHALFLEFERRLQDAGNSIAQIAANNSQPAPAASEQSISDLMFATFNLNRCQAIYDLLASTPQTVLDQTRQTECVVIDPNADRFFWRWLISLISRLRSKVFGYNDFYRMPPVKQYLKIYTAALFAKYPEAKSFLQKLLGR